MPLAAILDYLRLNRANGKAPHKPVLLLAVLKAFDEGLIFENRIEPAPELINLFNGYWTALVKEPNFQRRFYLPFFYLKNEPSGLWKLHTLPGFEHALTRGRDIKSLGALLAFQAYAELRADVFQRWSVPEHRAADRLTLMASYFPGQALPQQLPDHIREIEYHIEHDSPEAYVARQLAHIQEEEEEEQVLRSAAFKRKIPQLYGYRCAVTGLRVENLRNATLIDACHVVPWADSYNDTITNGIALCPNMHRAFDRGLISIADDLTLLVTPDLRENDSAYAIRPFAGKPLLLPADQQHWPARENLARHRERFRF
jgi:putative restriction endonuclease